MPPDATPLDWRQRGSLRVAALLAVGLASVAWLGRSADPAQRPLPPAAAPDGALSLGAVIALTGNANLYGQDQRLGLDLAQRWFARQARRDPAASPRPVRLQLEDGASDEASAIAAFNPAGP